MKVNALMNLFGPNLNVRLKCKICGHCEPLQINKQYIFVSDAAGFEPYIIRTADRHTSN
jgi:hypothetical protein